MTNGTLTHSDVSRFAQEYATGEENFTYSDTGNGLLFAKLYEKAFRYNVTHKTWMAFDGHRWVSDSKGLRYTAIADLRDVWHQMAGSMSPDEYPKCVKHAGKLHNRQTQEAALCLAQWRLPVEQSQFDSDPMVFNAANGSLNLRSLIFKKHDPADLLSKISATSYTPGATSPLWSTTMNNLWFPGKPTLVEYLKLSAGLSLSGLTDVQCFFFLFGHGSNGKSVFFEVMRLILGEYYHKSSAESLFANNDPRESGYSLAEMAGARMVVFSELASGRRFDEELLKNMTGGEPITARRAYGLPFSYKPQFKTWVFGNHKPGITGVDLGIWRRVKLIPFERQIPDDRKIPMSELLAMFETEAPGILNWLIAGLTAYLYSGLGSCHEVDGAVVEYKSENDALGQFIEEACDEGTGFTVMGQVIYAGYSTWCKTGNERPLARKTFFARLRERGFSDRKTMMGIEFSGIRCRNGGMNEGGF